MLKFVSLEFYIISNYNNIMLNFKVIDKSWTKNVTFGTQLLTPTVQSKYTEDNS